MSNSTPATISVDVDPLDLHLLGYGVSNADRDRLVYEIALPRLVRLLAETGARATFFLVARDAAPDGPFNSEGARLLTEAGHEIASHSLHHGTPFRKLPPAQLRHDLTESKRRLELVSGRPVAGFRAPNWDLAASDAPLLAECGYRYDASAYPTALLCAARLAVALRGGGIATIRNWKFLPMTWRRLPHRIGPLLEFPITTSGLARMPVYHTLWYRAADARIDRVMAALNNSGTPLFYTLHAIDVLGREDGIDPRLHRHPGMELPVAQKLENVSRIFRCISKYYQSRPYRELCELAW